MTPDHTFIDSEGTVTTGRDIMAEGWRHYFQMFPDFQISTDYIIQRESLVGVFGSWTGTFAGRDGCLPGCAAGGPAAWRAEVVDEQVKVWQIYTDHTKTHEIIDRFS